MWNRFATLETLGYIMLTWQSNSSSHFKKGMKTYDSAGSTTHPKAALDLLDKEGVGTSSSRTSGGGYSLWGKEPSHSSQGSSLASSLTFPSSDSVISSFASMVLRCSDDNVILFVLFLVLFLFSLSFSNVS